jgi:putative DNA primase/helicase
MTEKQDGAAQVARALENATPIHDIGASDVHGIKGEAPDDVPVDEVLAAHTAKLINTALYPLTDYGNGLRLLDHFGDDVLFVPRLGWFRWDGRKWQADEDAFLVRCDAQAVAGLILEEIPHLALEDYQIEALEKARLTAKDRHALLKRQKTKAGLEPDEETRLEELLEIEAAARPVRVILNKMRSDHRSHAKQSGNSGRITNMILEAGARRRVSLEEMNADPLAINCENGLLRLVQDVDEHEAAWGKSAATWQAVLGPHDRRAMCSKMMRAPYVPDAPRPNFERFLASIMPDPALREFLKRWWGYTLTGLTSEQKLAFFYGVGRNGKSTMVDVIAKIVDDYGSTLPIESLTGSEQRKGSEATPDLVRLPGARLVRASEPEQGQKMREALVKSLTGGEPVNIRRMHQEFVEVRPEFKLTIQGNHRPDIRGGDDGIWRRILLVPFDTQVPEDQVDPLLPQKLWDEREGIFAWMVEGALAYLADGLAVPDTITAATMDYRRESEPMRVFLLEECVITGDAEDYEWTRDIGKAFNAWRTAAGEATWTNATISKKVKQAAETLFGENGARFEYLKRSDAGYKGLRVSKEAKERVELYPPATGRG